MTRPLVRCENCGMLVNETVNRRCPYCEELLRSHGLSPLESTESDTDSDSDNP